MIAFRHADPRFSHLREDSSQSAGRWNAAGELTHYFCDTPDGPGLSFSGMRKLPIRRIFSPFAVHCGPLTSANLHPFNPISLKRS